MEDATMTNAGQDAARAMQGLGDELRRSYVTGRPAPEHTDHAAEIHRLVKGAWRRAMADDAGLADTLADIRSAATGLQAERDALRAYARALESEVWGGTGPAITGTVDDARAEHGVTEAMDAER
jgi:hypothetical protein